MGLKSWFKKSKDDSEKILEDVMNKVLPHLGDSVKAHVEEEKQKVVSSVIAKMQAKLNDSVPQLQTAPSVPVTASLALQPNVAGSQNSMLQHVIEQMAPLLDESVKRIVDQERDALVGNVLSQVQNIRGDKTQK